MGQKVHVKDRRWKKRVTTGVIRKEPMLLWAAVGTLNPMYHYGWMTIDYIHEGGIRHRTAYARLNFTLGRAEAVHF